MARDDGSVKSWQWPGKAGLQVVLDGHKYGGLVGAATVGVGAGGVGGRMAQVEPG